MVSVCFIIPAFNAADFIVDTVERALAQDVPGTEVVVVVVDDGTVAVARRYPQVKVQVQAQVLTQRTGGDASARHNGFLSTRSDDVIFLDHADVLHPGAVRSHLAAFTPGVDMVFVENDLIDAQGRPQGQNRPDVGRISGRDVALGTTPSISQCMYRRQALQRIGGFRTHVGFAGTTT